MKMPTRAMVSQSAYSVSTMPDQMKPPTFQDVVAAGDFVAPYLTRTPLVRLPKISQLLECDYFAKLENLQPIGAFKVRGGINLVGREFGDPTDGNGRQATVITPSTGNHGQSIAFAGRIFQTRVIIYAPAENVNEFKMQAMRDLGADVRLHGRNFDEARIECERVANEENYRYIHAANEPALIAGVGSLGLEIFDELPDVDMIVAPAGGGSCASSTCIVAKEINPEVQVVAVQSENAPAMWHAWKTGKLEPHPRMDTEHEGIATQMPFALPIGILRELLDDFVLTTDAQINEAIRLLTTLGKQVAEGAGAASLAGALKLRDQVRGKKVVGILTGGNIPAHRLASLLN